MQNSSFHGHVPQKKQPWYELPCSFELISHGTVFFSHNKITLVGLSAIKTISPTALIDVWCIYMG
jgi:hypothetical protein